ncbi:MAG: 1-phosphofructokinase, partial [Oscillospiraceae bacterium]|nr:1-phosphofructokinase [Oscillospiraceae bacterium]
MVYTVTFNPALDYVVRMSSFEAGATNRTESDEIQWGGKGINVSTVLRNLGIDNVALGFLAGFTGQALDQGLRKVGIATDFIWLPEGLTRINVKIKAGQETEINGMGPGIPAAALEELFAKLDRLQKGDVLVLAGSIPASLPDDVYQRILARLEGRDILTVVDATRDLLCAVLPYRPFLIKPNNHELGEIFGKVLTTDGEIEDCARKLQERGARNVLVSMAGAGSLLLDETGAVHRLGVPKGKVVN